MTAATRRGGDERGEVGAGVEDAGGEGALFGGEPLGGGLDGGGKVAGFAETEADAGDVEAKDGGDEGVRDRRQAPDQDGEGVAGFGAEPVDKAAGGEQTDAVGDLEEDDDVSEVVIEDGLMEAVGGGIPAHERHGVKDRLDEREDRTIHVVDGGGEEEQAADEPADV